MTSFLKDIQFASDSRNVDEIMSEHWAFSTNNIQFQAVNCCKCGNYKCSATVVALDKKIKCECSSKSVANGKSGSWAISNEDDDMYALPADNDSYSYNKELATKMVLYEQMGVFMDVEKERDLLCEDVVGLILEYL
jgi:hypothetical protein